MNKYDKCIHDIVSEIIHNIPFDEEWLKIHTKDFDALNLHNPKNILCEIINRHIKKLI